MIQQEGGNLFKYNLQKQRMTGQPAYQYKLPYWSMDERNTKAVVLFPCADARESGLLDGVLFLGLGFGGGGLSGPSTICSYPVVLISFQGRADLEILTRESLIVLADYMGLSAAAGD